MVDQLIEVSDRTRLSYYLNKQIGRGAFSTVFQGFIGNDSSKVLAVKRIQRTDVKEELYIVEREISHMWTAHNHCNILRFICSKEDVHFWYLATELCQGTLDDYVIKKDYQEGTIRFQSEKEVLLQVTEGLAHLHRHKIIHRDIKPSNILIFIPEYVVGQEQKVNPLMKLADFGLSKHLKSNQTDLTEANLSQKNPNRITGGWTAPELYDDQYDFQVDIFPLGCIFGYTLSGGKHLFGDDRDKHMYAVAVSDRIIKKEPMQLVQKDFKEPYSKDESAFKLIQIMTDMDPAKRPTVDQVLRNAFFKIPSKRENDQSLFDSIQTTTQFINFCNADSFKNLSEDEMEQFVIWVTDPKVTIDINAPFMGGWTLLHYICFCYYENQHVFELISLLLGKGANVNALDQYGETSLHNLCERYKGDNLIDLVRLFLSKGANVRLQNPDGWNILHLLCNYYNNTNLKELLELLIHEHMDVDAKTLKLKWTPLHFLLKKYKHDNMIELVRLLLDNGADVNAKNLGGSWTPLHILIHNYKHNNMIDTVQLLVDRGADVNAPTSLGFTPLYFLKFYPGDPGPIEQLLREHGADTYRL